MDISFWNGIIFGIIGTVFFSFVTFVFFISNVANRHNNWLKRKNDDW
jgi:hypothetical protein